MTTNTAYALSINIVIDDLYQYFDTEKELLAVLLELFDQETVTSIIDSLVSVLSWVESFLAELEKATVALDGALALFEVAAKTIEFITGQFKDMMDAAQNSNNDLLSKIGNGLGNFDSIDMSSVNAIGSYLPNPDDIASIRDGLKKLISNEPNALGILTKMQHEITQTTI